LSYENKRNDQRLWLRVSEALKSDLEAEARSDRRPVSEYARLELERLMEAKKRRRKP
jgi:hypothetical protein